MNHSEFVQAWNNGELEIDVDRTKAINVANSKLLPKNYQLSHMIWSWVWILSIPAAIAVGYFYQWWLGLLLLVFLTPTLSSATKKSAMQFMIDHSLENSEFYEIALSENIIQVREKT